MMYWSTGLFGFVLAVVPFAEGYQEHLSSLNRVAPKPASRPHHKPYSTRTS